MARPKSREEKVHLSVQVPPALLAAIDGEAKRLEQELGVPINRTTALTKILKQWQDARAAR